MFQSLLARWYFWRHILMVTEPLLMMKPASFERTKMDLASWQATIQPRSRHVWSQKCALPCSRKTMTGWSVSYPNFVKQIWIETESPKPTVPTKWPRWWLVVVQACSCVAQFLADLETKLVFDVWSGGYYFSRWLSLGFLGKKKPSLVLWIWFWPALHGPLVPPQTHHSQKTLMLRKKPNFRLLHFWDTHHWKTSMASKLANVGGTRFP